MRSIVLAAVLISHFAGGGGDEKKPEARKPSASLVTSALVRQYLQNEVALEESLGGKFIEVSGPVIRVSRLSDTVRLVTLNAFYAGSRNPGPVRCIFANDAKLSSLANEQPATIRGVLKVGRDGLSLLGCELVEIKPAVSVPAKAAEPAKSTAIGSDRFFVETYGEPTRQGIVPAGKILTLTPAKWFVFTPQRVRIVFRPAESESGKTAGDVAAWEIAYCTDPVTRQLLPDSVAEGRLQSGKR